MELRLFFYCGILLSSFLFTIPGAYFNTYLVHISASTLDCAYFSTQSRKKTTNICLALCTGTPHDHSMRVLPWEITLCDNDHYWLLMFRLEQVSCRIIPDGPEYSSTWDMRNLWRKPPVIGPDLWNLAKQIQKCFCWNTWDIHSNLCVFGVFSLWAKKGLSQLQPKPRHQGSTTLGCRKSKSPTATKSDCLKVKSFTKASASIQVHCASSWLIWIERVMP